MSEHDSDCCCFPCLVRRVSGSAEIHPSPHPSPIIVTVTRATRAASVSFGTVDPPSFTVTEEDRAFLGSIGIEVTA